MKLAAVRRKQEKQAVGLFFYKNIAQLQDLVDEVCNIEDCEFLPIDRPAAIAWEGKVSAKFGPPVDFDESVDEDVRDIVELKEKLSFMFAFGDLLQDGMEDGWLSLCPEQEDIVL